MRYGSGPKRSKQFAPDLADFMRLWHDYPAILVGTPREG